MTRQTQPFHRMNEYLVICGYFLKHFVLQVQTKIVMQGLCKQKLATSNSSAVRLFPCAPQNTFVNQLNCKLRKSYSISRRGQFRKSHLIALTGQLSNC